jgi:hypothetical protein
LIAGKTGFPDIGKLLRLPIFAGAGWEFNTPSCKPLQAFVVAAADIRRRWGEGDTPKR